MRDAMNVDIDFLQSLMMDALKAADPLLRVPPCLPSPPKGRTLVIGAGKAAARMARAVETNWHGPLSGMVITRFGHSEPTQTIEVIEAGHPVPEQNGARASQEMLSLIDGLNADDLVLCLISGGGSSLFEVPAPGLTLEDTRLINRQLLHSGAPINEMNCVRKHLSVVKGGQLAARIHPAKLVTIAISDVPGDTPSTIASGPTVPDPTTQAMARDILTKYGISLPAGGYAFLNASENETPKANDPLFGNTQFLMAARPDDMVSAVCHSAKTKGMEVLNLGADIEGEAREVGFDQAKLALNHAGERSAGSKPLLIVSGGETSVTVKNPDGNGGRNSEYLLALALGLEGHPQISALAIDTDGIDGTGENAGAWLTPDCFTSPEQIANAERQLEDNCSLTFFQENEQLIVTGPTRTNVNDLRLILINPAH